MTAVRYWPAVNDSPLSTSYERFDDAIEEARRVARLLHGYGVAGPSYRIRCCLVEPLRIGCTTPPEYKFLKYEEDYRP